VRCRIRRTPARRRARAPARPRRGARRRAPRRPPRAERRRRARRRASSPAPRGRSDGRARPRDRAQHLRERRQAVPRLGREVRAGVERAARRRQEDRRRPAALPRQRDAGVHRQRVDIGALLAIDLHVHEQVVHEGRHTRIGERLVLHHVAPVARAVPDGDEERPVLVPCAGERVLAPRIPVDGVLGVLEEVRARGRGKTVHSDDGTSSVPTCAAASSSTGERRRSRR
jgi:hypothetical protein